MVSLVSVDGKKNEIKPLESVMRNISAYLSEDKWDFKFFGTSDEFKDYMNLQPLVDIGCVDVALNESMELLYSFRRQYDSSLLILIADPTISPMAYLKPGIRPDSLLMRPLSKEMVKEALSEVFASYLSTIVSEDNEKSYVVDGKEGKISIPYSNIFYFEAREKKIFIRTLNDEFGFYETIEKIQEELPDSFARCHRSYIINKDKISKVMLSQSLIEMESGFVVPLSRSYKPDFKNFGK